MSEVVSTFGNTPERLALCKGLVDYRKALRTLGITQGFQWLNGSFCEDCEKNRSRAPADIDIVNLLVRPASHQSAAEWGKLVHVNAGLFDPNVVKKTYGCHAYSVDITPGLQMPLSQVTYWFGLFTHQRTTALWKGILQVSLLSDDDTLAAKFAPSAPAKSA